MAATVRTRRRTCIDSLLGGSRPGSRSAHRSVPAKRDREARARGRDASRRDPWTVDDALRLVRNIAWLFADRSTLDTASVWRTGPGGWRDGHGQGRQNADAVEEELQRNRHPRALWLRKSERAHAREARSCGASGAGPTVLPGSLRDSGP